MGIGRNKRASPKYKVTIQIELSDHTVLKAIALKLGFVIPSGSKVGEGNISGMMQAIGRKELVVRWRKRWRK
jgi:seryl-tRNA(Sec) selenium transferase